MQLRSLARAPRARSLALALLIAAGGSQARAVTLDFEDQGVAPGELADLAPVVASQGFEIVVGPDFALFDQLLVGSPGFWPSKGTTVLAHNGDAIVSRADGDAVGSFPEPVVVDPERVTITLTSSGSFSDVDFNGSS